MLTRVFYSNSCGAANTHNNRTMLFCALLVVAANAQQPIAEATAIRNLIVGMQCNATYAANCTAIQQYTCGTKYFACDALNRVTSM